MARRICSAGRRFRARRDGDARTTKRDLPWMGPGHYGAGGGGRTAEPASFWSRRVTPGFGFGTSSREPGGRGRTPGPGQYSMKSTLGGPNFSLAARRERRSPENGVPGPGAHEHHPDFEDYWKLR